MKQPLQPQHDTLSPLFLVALLVVGSLLLGYNIMTHLDVGLGDENVHRFQINWFIKGRFEIFKYIPMLPLYHGVVAAIAKLTGLHGLDGLRFAHMLFAVGVIPAMYALVRCFHPTEAMSRTLLLVFVPFLFPLFFITYTDLPSLMFVLLMVERAWKKCYLWAAALALVAVLMRTPNIIWVAFTTSMILLNTAKEMSVGIRLKTNGAQRGLLDKPFLLAGLRRISGFLVVFALFIVFVVINGGVAIGDAEQHPVSYNPSNLYFFLLVAFVLFLPFCVEQVPDIYRLLRKHWWIIGLLILVFFYYFYTYEHPHKYNRTSLKYYRHNLFIHYTSDYFYIRIASFFPMAWMALSFVTGVRKSEYGSTLLLILPFALLSFIPLPLIEHRYYVVTLTLFLAIRPRMSAWSTGATLTAFVLICAYVMFNISRQLFFL